MRRDAGRLQSGGVGGNEILTSATGAVLACLLLGEGATILWLQILRVPHMFIGVALVPVVLLKLGSTGYRFARYYRHTPAYRRKGPPQLPLRLLAPVLVLMTVAVFATGVALLALGHRSDQLLLIHKVTFIVWGAVFGVHFLAYLPRVVRSLRDDWRPARGHLVAGSGLRAATLATVLALGVGVALVFLTAMERWQQAHL
jgi:hypothetical protein